MSDSEKINVDSNVGGSQVEISEELGVEITEDDRNFFINSYQPMNDSRESDKNIEEVLLYKTEFE